MQRRVLPDCCEDWILTYGRYYDDGQEFVCLECGAPWRRETEGRFRQGTTSAVYQEAERRGYRYLSPESEDAPATERCCAQILTTYGPTMRVNAFQCPVCGTPWT